MGSSPTSTAADWLRSASTAFWPVPETDWYVATVTCSSGERRCRAASTGMSCIVEQFGFAIRPECVRAAWGFTSATTSGTPSSMRKAEELSTTTAPAAMACGAHSRERVAPAEKIAMSIPSKLCGPTACTGISRPA